jgi:hypothetical protein
MSAADLLRRLQSMPAGSSLDIPAIRDEIHHEFDRAESSTEREMLLAIHKMVLDRAERAVRSDDLPQLQAASQADYRLFLTKESLIGENISVDLVAAVTDREIQAERMSPDDDFRELAVQGLAAPHLSPKQLRALADANAEQPPINEAPPTGGWFSRLGAKRRRARKLENNPLVTLGREAVRSSWTEHLEISKQHSREYLENIARQLLDEVVRVAESDDPVRYNRDRLVEFGTMAACYEVLLMDSPPLPDVTGLRGHLGVSGELKAHLPQLRDEVKNLTEFDVDLPQDALHDVCLVRYRQCHAAVHVHHTLRFALDDCSKESELDWFRPLYAIQCALAECRYRGMLQMPQNLSLTECSELASMITLVQAGEKWPKQAWERRYGRKLL